jgi:hypothetical protein
MAEMAPVVIMKKFFGTKPGQTLQEFNEELKQLSPEERDELVKLAAAELGVEVKK